MIRPILKTPEHIINLEHYVSKINPEATRLSQILHSYDIRPFTIKCALCGQEHMDGRIISLGDKSITNIGHMCGKKYFREAYTEALRKHSETLGRPILTRKIQEGKRMVDSLQLRLSHVENRSLALRQKQARFENMFPDITLTLRRRALENKPDVHESVERSKKEIDDLLAANPYQSREGLRIKEVDRGTIDGHKFPATDWSLEHGPFRIFKEAIKFLDLDVRNLSMGSLAVWTNWLEDFDHNSAQAGNAVTEGERFFSEKNFKLFTWLTANAETQTKLRALTLQSFEVPVTVSAPVAPTVQVHRGRIRAKAPAHTMTNKELRRLLGDKKARFH